MRYLARGSGYTLFLTDNAAVMTIAAASDNSAPPDAAARQQDNPSSTVLRFSLAGANQSVPLQAENELASYSNYFIGDNPQTWHTHVPNYARVTYQNVYPGVDLAYYGNAGQLEYDFIARPGADPSRIHLKVAGADFLALDGSDLIIHTAMGDLR